jgi:transcriptional regulator of heat shock response
MTLRQVEFLPLSERRVLAILVLNGQEVQNRIIQTRRPYDAAELQRAANYLNAAVWRPGHPAGTEGPAAMICARPATISTG